MEAWTKLCYQAIMKSLKPTSLEKHVRKTCTRMCTGGKKKVFVEALV